MKNRIVTVSVITLVSAVLLSITWFESTHKCPICKTKNRFYDIGSYIYQWDSKFQYIYWPLIDERMAYSCKTCHLSTYMWDFDSLDNSKIPALKEYLETQKWSVSTADYLKVPLTERLEIAEGVYKILERDDDFWCNFYRVKGFHYDAEHNKEKAALNRRKALEIVEKQKADSLQVDRLKELLLISGSMKYF